MRYRPLLMLWLATAACSTPDGPTHFARHFEALVWSDALGAQVQKKDQLALELALLGATAGLAVIDHKVQRESNEDQSITSGSTKNGDAVAVGLGVTAVGLGAAEWIGGDEGHAAEVLFESFVATDAITEILKRAIGRRRPGDGSRDSFPSGHTSFSFAMATFVQRRLADTYPGWLGDLGYLAYIPAAYVGIDRSEANRHWPTDVAFGAFLGVFLTNVVYDAHYGEPGTPGLFGVHGLALEPELDEEGTRLAVVWRF